MTTENVSLKTKAGKQRKRVRGHCRKRPHVYSSKDLNETSKELMRDMR